MPETIIIFGDDPTLCTGFAKVVDHLVDAVIKSGYNPVVVGLKYNLGDYPKAKLINSLSQSDGKDYHGWETLENTIVEYKAKMLITVGDPWDYQGIASIKERSSFVWIGYVPVESPPYPRFVMLSAAPRQILDVGELLSKIDHIVTFSKFGATAINDMLVNDLKFTKPDSNIPKIDQVYLGVDSEFFTPINKKEARKIFKTTDSDNMILFTCIKVNSFRSGFDSLLHAWSLFVTRIKKNKPELYPHVKLYLHTDLDGAGFQIPVLLRRFNIANSVIINNDIKLGRGFPKQAMVSIHSATDIAISATRGEGFGIPIVEAMSCKIPCIVPDYGCPTEYGGSAVQRTPIAATFNPDFSATDFAIIDVKKMANMMYNLILNPSKRQKMGEAGRSIAKKMGWDVFINKSSDIIIKEYEDKASKIKISDIKFERI